ncbi:MAG: FtsX-like permease family protein [Syntrophales bacterium]|nr:FtsX-like permease family protein [Syntrophales bacterium]
MKLYHISISNLRRRKGKVVFLALGLVIGIATIVILLSVTQSMTRNIEERLDRFGANMVMVPRTENLSLSYGGITVGGVNYRTVEFDEARIGDIRRIKDNKNIGIIAPKVIGSTVINEKDVLLIGVDFESEFALKNWWRLDGDTPKAANDLLFGVVGAVALRVSRGDQVIIAGRTFDVAAILQRTGAPEDGVVIGDLHEIQGVLGKKGKISMVELAAFCRGCPISEIVLQIAEKFPDARVTALEQVVMAKMQSVEMFRSFSYGIAALVIFVGSLLVFVTMMGFVNERTREIGIFRAIGFRQGHVMQIILLEAMIVGFVAGLVGFLAGSIVARVVIPLVIQDGTPGGILSPSLGMISVLLGVSLSLMASLYPARKASRLDPSAALRAL